MMTLSDSAAARINSLTASGPYQGQKLRLRVDAGGCAGFEYKFSFDDNVAADDHVVQHQGAAMVIDETSLGLLQGAVLDYSSDLMGAMFVVKNPQATSGCGCGNSFGL